MRIETYAEGDVVYHREFGRGRIQKVSDYQHPQYGRAYSVALGRRVWTCFQDELVRVREAKDDARRFDHS